MWLVDVEQRLEVVNFFREEFLQAEGEIAQ